MLHKGLAGASPLDPGRRYGATPRRFGPAVDAVSRAVAPRDDERRANPASGSARSAAAVKSLRDSSADAAVLRMTAAADRAGIAVADQPEGWPALQHEQAAPLRCRGEPDPTRDRIGHHQPSACGSEQRTGRREPDADCGRPVAPVLVFPLGKKRHAPETAVQPPTTRSRSRLRTRAKCFVYSAILVRRTSTVGLLPCSRSGRAASTTSAWKPDSPSTPVSAGRGGQVMRQAPGRCRSKRASNRLPTELPGVRFNANNRTAPRLAACAICGTTVGALSGRNLSNGSSNT